jgi:cation diffusion facilitator family transporter
MINFLVRTFIKDYDNTSDPDVREAYGSLAGIAGVIFNVVLFAAKYLAGVIAGSIAITADAFNNLSDAGSSLITLFGFKLAGQKPHSDHPFGHGRWEYIAGLIVSLFIIMMGFDLLRESVGKIFHPEATVFSPVSIAILAASILVKLYMCHMNRTLGRRINSVAISATAIDSLSDSVATFVVLVSMFVTRFTGVHVDGYAGALVALMIIWAGISAARDTISPLLGNPPDQELVNSITDIVRSCDMITGMHDLVVHDYGAGRRMISLHAEVPADGDIMATHDAIDLIERRLARELHCHAVIHMDPLATDDALISATRNAIINAIHHDMDDRITIHDFRMVTGPTHTNVIFDAVLPQEDHMSDEDARKKIAEIVSGIDPTYNAVINIDIPYA